MSDAEPRRPDLDGEELAELRAAIAAVREQIQTRLHGSRKLPGVGPWLEDLARGVQRRLGGVDAMELYEDLRRRVAVLGMEERSGEVDEFGLDPVYLERARPLLALLYERWWRVEVTGAEHLPPAGRVILVANRSGILPYDGLMIAEAVEREHPAHPRPRFLVADWLVTLPFIQPLLARIGGVRACPENAERLVESGHWTVVFPEGQKGALKPFRDRYRLQRFGRGGFVSLAVRLRASIVPVAVVGAEEAHPILFRPGLPARLLGVPVPITPTFPHLGPLGLVPLPSQWRIAFGAPVRMDDVPREQADDPLYRNLTRERIRGAVQTLLDEEVQRRSSVWSG
jgi:1-acyl-sn-glycerol-3-phosphate acyltransferase